MTNEQPKRRGGWPGPRKPKWAFRPTPETEASVAAYIERHGLDPERGRSKAINALLAERADRETLVNVIVYHGRTSIKECHCGWAELGKSHAEHVADVYEASVTARADRRTT